MENGATKSRITDEEFEARPITPAWEVVEDMARRLMPAQADPRVAGAIDRLLEAAKLLRGDHAS